MPRNCRVLDICVVDRALYIIFSKRDGFGVEYLRSCFGVDNASVSNDK